MLSRSLGGKLLDRSVKFWNSYPFLKFQQPHHLCLLQYYVKKQKENTQTDTYCLLFRIFVARFQLMDHFTAGDRCLVHHLQSEAGRLLNGLHVKLIEGSVEKGRLKCRFGDGFIGNIKPGNLLPTTQPQQQQQQQVEKEECPICLVAIPNESSQYMRATCCGKRMHIGCLEDMCKSNMSEESKIRCVMCRTKYPKNDKENVEYVRNWAMKNKAWAQTILAQNYRDGTGGVEKNKKRAIVLFNLASEQGDASAQYNLGVMYGQGPGVKRDTKRAAKWYTLAAEQGFANAQINLGAMYQKGEGVKQDLKRALKWYTLAAEHNIAEAQHNLGRMYENGDGVEQSTLKAREWFEKAASQGHASAISALKQLDELEARTNTTTTTTSSIVTDNTTFCSNCNKSETSNHTLNNCQCKAAKYCNATCQKAHWEAHQEEHRRLKALLKN